MNQNCVVVAGGSRARFFSLQDPQVPEMESGPNLVELSDLVNPEKDARQRDLWSETKSGRNRSAASGAAHGYDDHREQHEDEFERRFARSVAEECLRLAQSHGTKNVVLVAQKRMLGFLRTTLDPVFKAGVEIQELAKDLSKLPPKELHEHLAREGLLPRRRSPTV
ncbi:MAG: host attachment protein [Gammaproteobacteria bacterium]|jgi:protein required for attachment to host cells